MENETSSVNNRENKTEQQAPALVVINTPETLGISPEYVLQHTAISRSIHNLSATAQKLTAMAMALLPLDLSSRTAMFSFNDFCKALGVSEGGNSFKLFNDAVNECMGNVIHVDTGKVIKGKTSWEKFTWFVHSSFDAETGKVTMKFSTELAAFLNESKKLYSKISLKDIGKLQSKYGIRLFEIASSYSSLAGKDGNSSSSWYFERTVDDWRLILSIPEGTYHENKDFRKRVIEVPIKEINAAGVGVAMKATGIKQGRETKAYRVECKKAPKTSAPRRGRKKKEDIQELPDMSGLSAKDRAEKELEHLKELYPDEYAELYTLEMAKMHPCCLSESFGQKAAAAAAKLELKKRHGIVK
ncbi:replication initiation protein [Breznakiellaceae bacterium SP9]